MGSVGRITPEPASPPDPPAHPSGDPTADPAAATTAEAAIRAAHDDAAAAGRVLYADPATGYFVFTAPALAARGYCCGSGCRHCPYPPDEQRRAGRPGAG